MEKEKFIVRNAKVRAGCGVIGVMAQGMRIVPYAVDVVDRNVFPAPVQVVRLVQVVMVTEQTLGIISSDGAGEEVIKTVMSVMGVPL